MSLAAQEPHPRTDVFEAVVQSYLREIAPPDASVNERRMHHMHVHRAWNAIYRALTNAIVEVADSDGVAALGTVNHDTVIVVLRKDVVSLLTLTDFDIEPKEGDPMKTGSVQVVQFRRTEETQVRVVRRVDDWDGAFTGAEVLEIETHGGIVGVNTEALYGEPRIAELVGALLV